MTYRTLAKLLVPAWIAYGVLVLAGCALSDEAKPPAPQAPCCPIVAPARPEGDEVRYVYVWDDESLRKNGLDRGDASKIRAELVGVAMRSLMDHASATRNRYAWAYISRDAIDYADKTLHFMGYYRLEKIESAPLEFDEKPKAEAE